MAILVESSNSFQYVRVDIEAREKEYQSRSLGPGVHTIIREHKLGA